MTDDLSTRERVAREWLLPFAVSLLSVVLLTGLISGLELLVGLTISGVEVVFAVALTGIGLTFWLVRVHSRRWPLVLLLMAMAGAGVILPNLVLGGRVLDVTWDGQWYHQEAVIQLADGWNPFRADLTAEEVPHEGARARINGYPKATWLWGTPLYRITHRIERAKAFSLPLMIAAGLVVLACLLLTTGIRPLTATAIAVVAAANPVATTQILNAFQDGAMASLLTIVVASLVLWIRLGSRLGLAVATAAAVGVASIKLTGPVYVVVLVACAVVWMWWKGDWRRQWRPFAIALAVAGVGVLLLSGGAYVTNLARHSHPMFPVFGPDKVPIVRVPPNDRFQGLAATHLLRSQMGDNDIDAVERLRDWNGLKWPFTFNGDELGVFFYPHPRIGGWGPLQGGVMLLAALLLGMTALRRPRWAAVIVAVATPIFLSVVVNPYCWKARYVPQLWLVPFVIVAMVLARRSTVAERMVAGTILAVAGFNALLVAGAHVPRVVAHSETVKSKLLDLGQRREALELHLQPFRSNRVRLVELGVAFREVDDFRYNLPVYLGYSSLKITALDLEPDSEGGGGRARVSWRATPGIVGNLVEVVMPGPAGPGGSVLTVLRRNTTQDEIDLPVPTGPFKIMIRNCNEIGCGVADVKDAVFAGGSHRRRPVLGVPYEGEIVRQPSVLFSWLPAVDDEGRPAKYRFRLADGETSETIVDEETGDLWFAHRFAADGVWSAAVAVVGTNSGETDELVFTTEGVATPRLIAPETGTTTSPGEVELLWEEVPGTSAYEYFVAVTGQPTAVRRGVTRTTRAVVDLTAIDGRATGYSIIVRACRPAGGCEEGSEIGWGPWSTEAGHGDVKLTVAP